MDLVRECKIEFRPDSLKRTGVSLVSKKFIPAACACVLTACAAPMATVPSGATSTDGPVQTVGGGPQNTFQPGDAIRTVPASVLTRGDGRVIGEVRAAEWTNSVALGIVASDVRPGRYSVAVRFSGRCTDLTPADRPLHVSYLDVASDGRVYTTMLALDMKLRSTSPGTAQRILLDSEGAALLIADERGAAYACAVLR